MAMIRIIFISFLATLVLSCGFELQNTSNIGEKLDALTIKTNNPYSIFYRTLRNQFRESGTKITDDVSQSDYTLTILMDESEQRTLSVSATITTGNSNPFAECVVIILTTSSSSDSTGASDSLISLNL